MSTLDHIQSTADARLNAKRRLPWMMFDFIDGAAGDEGGSELKESKATFNLASSFCAASSTGN